MKYYSEEDQKILLTEEGDYVTRNIDTRLIDFNEEKKLKILVVGDSYSEDFINILRETFTFKDISLSSHYLPFNCGNVFVDEKLSNKFIPLGFKNICKKIGWYSSNKLKILLREADLIILSSAWQEWEVEFLEETIKNISKVSSSPVYVVGRKDFGSGNKRILLGLDKQQRLDLKVVVSDFDLEIDQKLKQVVSEERFVDIFSYVCSGKDCPLFDENGFLISYDGDHLTSHGAMYLGKNLLLTPLFSAIMQEIE